jgi:hypothetical protein
VPVRDNVEAGQLIRAQDWNDLAKVVKDLQAAQQTLATLASRLQTDKLDAAGGRVTGTLTADVLSAPSVRSPGLGVDVTKPTGSQWTFSTRSSDWAPVITRGIKAQQPTAVLAIAHGFGKATNGIHPLDVAITLDGAVQMPSNQPNGSVWGMGNNTPSTDSPRHTGQIVALALCQLPGRTAEYSFSVCMRARGGVDEVVLEGPTLWLVRLGDYTAA